MSLQDSTERILPSLENVHREVRRIVTSLDGRIQALEATAADGSDEEANSQRREIIATRNLRHCVGSAATIVSSASTILARESNLDESMYCGSDLGEFVHPMSYEPTLAWLASSGPAFPAIQEEMTASSISNHNSTESKRLTVTSLGTSIPALDQSDSDSDLDTELVTGLLRKGRKRFAEDDCEGASRLLRNCLARIPSSDSSDGKSRMGALKFDVLTLQCAVYMQMRDWDGAQSALVGKMALRPHSLVSKDEAGLDDTCALSSILYRKEDYIQAQLYARKALRGYRKLGPSGADGVERTLILLVEICRASGNSDEGEAYSVMLENVLETKAADAATAETTFQFGDQVIEATEFIPPGTSTADTTVTAASSSSLGDISSAAKSNTAIPGIEVLQNIATPAEALNSMVSLHVLTLLAVSIEY